MGHSIQLTAEQEKYLKDNHLKLSYATMSRHIGVCVDTLKRMLVRLELQEFNGAKYHHKQRPKTWKRPCLKCQSTKKRPINQYICDNCKTGEDISIFEDENIVQTNCANSNLVSHQIKISLAPSDGKFQNG